MKYVPIWVPVILILGLVAVRLYRPLPVGDGAGARGAATICDFASPSWRHCRLIDETPVGSIEHFMERHARWGFSPMTRSRTRVVHSYVL